MHRISGKGGFRLRRRWMWAGIAGAVGGLVLYLRPWVDGPALLELVALGPDGRFDTTVSIPREWSDTTARVAGAVARVPLVLGVRNVGGTPARPTSLELNVPARYRLSRPDGRPLTGELAPGTPMVRYHLELPFDTIDPGRLPTLLPAADTIWLEPIIPSFYCMALSDSVPEFVPAPPAPIETIARVQIFYSFGGEGLEQRQTGLLNVRLDPGLLRSEAPRAPPLYPAEYREPAVAMPAFQALRYVGSRRAYCGEPDDPLELLSTLWETPDGGRFIVLAHGGAPRKYLFDLDRDSIVELEMWDPDSDGYFEARRAASLPIPAFLLPPPPAPSFDLAIFDGIPEDSLARLDRYAAALLEPYRYRTPPPDTAPRLNRFRPLLLEGTAEEDEDRVRRRPLLAPGSQFVRPPPSRRRVLGDAPPPATAPGGPAIDRTPPATGRPADRAPAHAEERVLPPVPSPDVRPPVGAPPAGAPPVAEPGDREGAGPEGGARQPARPEPKLLGRPVDSIRPLPRPVPLRPDTAGP
jgi:hypothetical protein